MRLPRFAVPSALLLASLLAASTSHADDRFPEPSSYPLSWQLDFTHSLPKRVVVEVPGQNTPVAYWYITYTVTNNSDREQTFLPGFDLLADDGRVIKGNFNIPQETFNSIRARERNKRLEPDTSITGKLRLGPAEARDGVAIWPEPMARMGHFSIFVSGLSGEAVTMKYVDGHYQHVTDAAELKNSKELVVLRKTLQLNFFIRGDEVYPGEDEVNQAAETWIMR